MTEFLEINIVNSIIVFFTAIIPLYLSTRLKGILKKLTLLLFVFVIVHAVYHVAEVFGYDELAENVLEPLSIVVLIIFGFLYLRIRNTRRIQT